jgi:hypothetical protein
VLAGEKVVLSSSQFVIPAQKSLKIVTFISVLKSGGFMLTLENITELYSGYNPLNDTERFNHIYDFVKTIYENEDKDTNFPFGLLLIAAISDGTNPNSLAHFCQMPLSFVTEVADRLTAAEIWPSDGSVDYEFLTAETEDLWDFWFVTSTLVAEGQLAWTGVRRDNFKVYQVTEAGLLARADHALGKSSAVHDC